MREPIAMSDLLPGDVFIDSTEPWGERPVDDDCWKSIVVLKEGSDVWVHSEDDDFLTRIEVWPAWTVDLIARGMCCLLPHANAWYREGKYRTPDIEYPDTDGLY